MRYVSEYRDPKLVKRLSDAIKAIAIQPHCIMEICGGQTHSIAKYGIDQLLPDTIELIHGPGCPVCVTDVALIDKAIAISQLPNVVLCSFGDMLRVPGSQASLLQAKSQGADVRIVYSPLDAVTVAQQHRDKEVVFFGVGFETTVPATALAVLQAEQQGVENFSLLVSHVLVPPAMEALLSSPECRINAFLAAGHVCTVMGIEQYRSLVFQYNVPVVVTGFEPADILQGILMCVQQLEAGVATLENQYARAVKTRGNQHAQQLIETVFECASQHWRGIGAIAGSGLRLRQRYEVFDAGRRFTVVPAANCEATLCISGDIMQGLKKPNQCAAFGRQCTPEHPLGAPMVSSEGACAAYYRYRCLTTDEA